LSRDPELYLEDIRIACNKIIRYMKGMTFENFKADDRTYDAVIRNLEIIGEAAKNIPEEICRSHPEIEWRAITALRNIVAHEYFGVRDEIIWDIATNKITRLQSQINHIKS
jgi:uncharacterized protein with HEPN domain